MTFQRLALGRILALGGLLALGLAACGEAADTPNPSDPAWAEYDAAFLQACKASATGDKEAIMEGLCGCTLVKIKKGYSAKFVADGKLGKEIIQNLSAECQMGLKVAGARFPDLARDDMVQGCVAEAAALGDKAAAYCECSVARLEKDYSYTDVSNGLVSPADYQELGAACVAEVGAGG